MVRGLPELQDCENPYERTGKQHEQKDAQTQSDRMVCQVLHLRVAYRAVDQCNGKGQRHGGECPCMAQRDRLEQWDPGEQEQGVYDKHCSYVAFLPGPASNMS